MDTSSNDLEPQSSARNLPVAVLSYFDLSPGGFPWKDPRPQQIERRRAALGDLLLFDILLTSGGIRQPDTLYPPVDVESFHRLLEAIQTSQYDALKRDCLVYFLLKWYHDGREDKFRLERGIPPQFATLSDAYFYLDAGTNIPRAVSILSDARLNRDYASKILQAISLAPIPMPLILKYVRTAKPLLTEPDDIDMYTIALAHSSLFEAWQFQRTFSEKSKETRPRLLRKILDWCFTPTPRHDALVQLLSLALTPYEQSLIQSYATPPSDLPPSAIATLQDLIIVRLIQTGRYADAIKLDRQFSSASQAKLVPQTERTKMVQELYAALPLVERAVLDAELENQGIPPSTSGASSMSGSGSREWDINMSWEDIRAPAPSAPPAPIPPLPGVHIPLLGQAPPVLNASGRSQETFRSKFGGFTQSVSAFPPLNASSSSSPRHVVPVIPVSGVAKGSLATQPFVPSARQSLGSSTSAFAPLSQSTSRLAASSTPAANSTKSLFESAARKQNAFYQPPAAPEPVSMFEERQGDEGGRSKRGRQEEDADVEMDQDVDLEMSEDQDQPDGDQDHDGLAYSVFGGKPIRTAPRAGKRTRPLVETKQVPPGAFENDDEPEVAPPPPAPPRQTRRSTATKSAAPKQTKVPNTRRTRANKQDLGRSLPGSLMDSEDGSADEGEDELAPLPPRQATAGEAAPPRRRSSRLSSSSDIESRTEKEKAPTKSKSGPGRKRRL
ncbi:nuclear pore complex assembly-domain-containing protein [Mycena rebaudengoi]|nr:nuclear pore complex assembly-domain-containing protein [Mycena rebaudengoi]